MLSNRPYFNLSSIFALFLSLSPYLMIRNGSGTVAKVMKARTEFPQPRPSESKSGGPASGRTVETT